MALSVVALGCTPAPADPGDEGTDGKSDDADDEEEGGDEDPDPTTDDDDTTDDSSDATSSSGMTSSPSTSGDAPTTSTTAAADEGLDVVADEGPVGDCTFQVTSSVSPTIETVGIVEWSVDLPSVEMASIEFGPDTSYGMTAPVDLAEPEYRTLLLGLKGDQEYHFRIRASGGGMACESGDYTIQTGLVPNALPKPTVTTANAAALAGGFLVSGFYQSQGFGGAYAFIMDADHDFVWYYSDPEGTIDQITSTKMTYDGKSMWIRNANVPNSNQGAAIRVSMDGMLLERAEGVAATHHDFAVLPDGTLGMLAYGQGCDVVLERAPDGTVSQIFDVQDAHGSSTCHTNSIHYHPEDDTYTVSDLGAGFGGSGSNDVYIKITRTGEVLWVLGGDGVGDFTGDGAEWTAQHGHHLLSGDRLLFFNNGSGGGGGGSSLAIEVQLDLSQMTATRIWTYEGGLYNQVMGDVQRLENGNTLVVYSTRGTVHEVDPAGTLVGEFEWSAGALIGYVTQRPTLYGPPPR